MNQHGGTPLINAAWIGHLPVLEYLVDRGANICAMDEVSDITPVDMKAQMYHSFVYLLNASARRHSINTGYNE